MQSFRAGVDIGGTFTDIVLLGDRGERYTKKVSSTVDGPAIPGRPAGGTRTTTIDAKWSGPCKPDQKPGDIIAGGGRKFNIRDMQNLPGFAGQKR